MRFNALLGAARTAEDVGEPAIASGYYRQLLANCTSANGAAVEKLARARAAANRLMRLPFSSESVG